MATLIIAGLIVLTVCKGIHSFFDKSSSCGECKCSCPINERRQKLSEVSSRRG